jgi:hypothetical protein
MQSRDDKNMKSDKGERAFMLLMNIQPVQPVNFHYSILFINQKYKKVIL